MKRILKRTLKIVLVLVVLIAIGATYLYFRLNNDIENVLEAKNDWRSEVLEFPLIFAGDLEYEGEEHVRFAPGWGETDSEDYFSYVFLWILDQEHNLNAQALEKEMNIYFDGLMNTGALTKFHFFKKIPETSSSFNPVTENSFEGTIELYDEFFKNELILLNTEVKSEYCSELNKHFVWFYLSPQEKDHSIWTELKAINHNLKCD